MPQYKFVITRVVRLHTDVAFEAADDDAAMEKFCDFDHKPHVKNLAGEVESVAVESADGNQLDWVEL